jgi:hypothetical protein
MAASTEQRDLLARLDPLVSGDPAVQAILDDLFDDANAINLDGVPSQARDHARVNYVIHQARMRNPQIADSPAQGGEPALLPGYPSDWYQTGAGRRLIGLFSSSGALAPQ